MSLSVVVGAARGIGRAIAEDLARAEPDRPLLLADIDGAAVEQVAAELAARGVKATARTVDVGSPSSVADLVAESREADRVAIAAGIFRSSSALVTPPAEFEEVLSVNTVGCFHVAQLYAAAMVENGGGAVVAVASISARMPRMRQAAYSASKAALRQGLRVLAMEVAGQGVRINTVSPGPTDTEMMRELASDHKSVVDLASGSLEASRPRIPAGHVATAEDISAAVAFLLSPASRHIVMADLVVDGGELLGM
ncbi:SDR family oxidoreductase [Nocardioides marmoriginsengisoli]|uniref:SDR family oxidoreductase n=1 Tax=Nocardioides marmoriginsengisoli TaxID=661483 RepID=A0A3N0CGD5_9ACTN|nr:SDR family oxidoreductase [Nocardioides marmoriginsengisoli]RNL62532.1 SDR family oxidoreductase [Nocardioides marmoriginsengisoli]